MEEYGLTQEQVADRMGRPAPAIANTLRLLALPEDLLTLVEEGTLSAGHARAILGAPTAELQREAAKQMVSRGLSVRQTEQLVKLLQKQPEETRKGGSTDEIALYLGELEKSLSGQLGRKVTISHHGKKGRVQLEYYNNEDLEALPVSAEYSARRGRTPVSDLTFSPPPKGQPGEKTDSNPPYIPLPLRKNSSAP